jgi:DNA-binding response OmpR family regulator
VDDDSAALNAVARIARDAGYTCRTAASGEEAIAQQTHSRADILISDLNMPEMSGLELCRTLKAQDPRLYVLLVTAQEDARSLEGVRGGVDDFLPKPVDIGELVIRLGAAERLVRALHVVERVRDALRSRSG